MTERPMRGRATPNLRGQARVCAAMSNPDFPRNMDMQNNPTKTHKAVFIALGFVYIYLHLKDIFTS